MARSFNGSSDYIDIGSVASLSNITGPLTVAHWILFTSLPSVGNLITSFSSGRNATQQAYTVDIFNNSGTILLRMNAGGTNAALDITALATTNTWYHVTGIFYGNNLTPGSTVGLVEIIIRSPSGSVAAGAFANPAGPPSGIGTTDVTIGVNNSNGSLIRYWPGSIADCAVWSTVINPVEILGLSQGARPSQIQPASLLGYWPLYGNLSPEPDLSGKKNNGTLHGTGLASNAPPADMETPIFLGLPILGPGSVPQQINIIQFDVPIVAPIPPPAPGPPTIPVTVGNSIDYIFQFPDRASFLNDTTIPLFAPPMNGIQPGVPLLIYNPVETLQPPRPTVGNSLVSLPQLANSSVALPGFWVMVTIKATTSTIPTALASHPNIQVINDRTIMFSNNPSVLLANIDVSHINIVINIFGVYVRDGLQLIVNQLLLEDGVTPLELEVGGDLQLEQAG